MDFQKIDTELDEDEDELFFEGPDADAVPAPVAIVMPAPESISAELPVEAAKPARKRVAKGKTAEVQPQSDPVAETHVAEAVDIAAEETFSTESEPIGEPVVIVRGARIPVIAMALAAIAALFSSAGLLVALRNMSSLEAASHDVAKREAALARLPALLEEVETLAARQRAELDRAAAQRPADIVTREDLARQMTDLRFGLSRMQAPGTSALAGVMRAGQAELADRIDDLGDRVDAIDRAKAARPAH